MSHYQFYEAKPLRVQAIRYGTDGEGLYYPKAVDDVTRFLLAMKIDEDFDPRHILKAVRPAKVQAWSRNPRGKLPVLEIFNAATGRWLRLHPGQMVVQHVDGRLQTMTHEHFLRDYAPMYQFYGNQHHSKLPSISLEGA